MRRYSHASQKRGVSLNAPATTKLRKPARDISPANQHGARGHDGEQETKCKHNAAICCTPYSPPTNGRNIATSTGTRRRVVPHKRESKQKAPQDQRMMPSPSMFHSIAVLSLFFFARRFSLRFRLRSSASCSILSLFMANRVSRSVTSWNLSSSRFCLR
jgi:hypothetical protein